MSYGDDNQHVILILNTIIGKSEMTHHLALLPFHLAGPIVLVHLRFRSVERNQRTLNSYSLSLLTLPGGGSMGFNRLRHGMSLYLLTKHFLKYFIYLMKSALDLHL